MKFHRIHTLYLSDGSKSLPTVAFAERSRINCWNNSPHRDMLLCLVVATYLEWRDKKRPNFGVNEDEKHLRCVTDRDKNEGKSASLEVTTMTRAKLMVWVGLGLGVELEQGLDSATEV